MKVKVSLKELKQAELALSKVLNASLPIKVSYWINKNMKPIIAELTLVEEKRVQLVKKYAVDKDGKPSQNVPKENMEALQNEFISLLDEEVEIDFTPIKLKDIENEVKLSAGEIGSLDKFIEV